MKGEINIETLKKKDLPLTKEQRQIIKERKRLEKSVLTVDYFKNKNEDNNNE